MSGRSAQLSPEGRELLPLHVAVIMDGNGRWAKHRNLPRIEGHRRGVESARAMNHPCTLGSQIGAIEIVMARGGRLHLRSTPTPPETTKARHNSEQTRCESHVRRAAA